MVKIRIMKAITFLLLFSITTISCTNLKEEISPLSNIESFGDLIHLGNEHIDDSLFSQICKALNDSLSKDSNIIIIHGMSSIIISETDSVVGWCFDKLEGEVVMPDFDIFYCYMTLKENMELSIKGIPRKLSDIQTLVTEYVFYPDTTYKDRIYRNKDIPEIGEIQLSDVLLLADVYVTKDGLSINDWYFFFDCLNELIKTCENERNLISLKVWGKDYRSLSFDNKVTLTDVIGYPIIIRFNL